jgi:hypothetical protein
LPFVQPPAPSKESNIQLCMYEVQKSMTLVGIDDQVWTAYGTMDTAFDELSSKDSVTYHHGKRIKNEQRLDPLTRRFYPVAGVSRKSVADASFNDARKYFWAVLDCWTIEMEGEYKFMLKIFEEKLEARYVVIFHPARFP